MDITDEQKEEYNREEAIHEWRQEQEDNEEVCSECGTNLNYELISSDADGNREEWGYFCPKCD